MVQIVQILQNEKIINIFNIVVWVWFIYFILLLIYLYIKSFRPYKTDFNEEFYTSIPSDLNIIEVSNLVNRKLNGNVLAAYIINLIRVGHLKIEIIDGTEYLVRSYNSCQPSIGDEATIKLVLYTMGDGNKVTIDDLYHFCDRKRNKNIMLMEYEIWCKVMKKENYKHIFYETKEEYGIVKFTSFLGCLIFLVDIILGFNNNLGYCTLLPALLLLFLFTKVYKRTRTANEEYKKWIAFREYLDNINIFDKVINDPELYIVYGTCLGIKGLENKITDHDYCERIVEAINRSVIKAILSGNRSL